MKSDKVQQMQKNIKEKSNAPNNIKKNNEKKITAPVG
jgi:hypothetical protein